jgi:hypothetical protein
MASPVETSPASSGGDDAPAGDVVLAAQHLFKH